MSFSSGLTGTVMLGINNIYTVKTDAGNLECRIKGKVLKGDRVYNPLTVGDVVDIEPDVHDSGMGMITERHQRKNVFTRYNRKRQAPQILLANVDTLACVTSSLSPPFRPRFIDRVLVAAEIGDLNPVIIVNKIDLGIPEDTAQRLADYQNLGYRVFYCSAADGRGIQEIAKTMSGRCWGLIGQSGVGKSSVLNALSPGLGLETGELSKKYNRGSHTTCQAAMFERGDLTLIDTPGIRELDIYGIEPMDLNHYFRDLVRFSGQCAFSPCLHDHEPGCKVKEALEEGLIHPDRYDSYLRTLYQLQSCNQGGTN